MRFAVVQDKVLQGQALNLPIINRQAMVAQYVQPTIQWLQGKHGEDADVSEDLRKLSADTVVEVARSKMGDEEFEAFSKEFESQYREAWMAYTAQNPGAVAYAINYMAHSDFIMPFWKDIQDGKIGRASTAPFFVLRGFDGLMHVVEPTDAAFHTCYCDRNFVAMRYRAEVERAELSVLSDRGGGKVCIVGGGCAPVTWAYGALPDNIEVTILDKEDYTDTLMELLEVPDLAQAHIDYRVGDFRETVKELQGQFDCVFMSGVLAYYHGHEKELLQMCQSLCKPSGHIVCDLQVKVMEDALDVMILGWPREMHVYDTVIAAVHAMQEVMAELGACMKVYHLTDGYGEEAGVAFMTWATPLDLDA